MNFKIPPISKALTVRIQEKIDGKTKPLGALGQLESIVHQICLIQQTETPALHHPHMVVFAADHGIATEGKVNCYPQEVTAQMVYNFMADGAAANSFCKSNKVALKIVDAGVNHNFEPTDELINAKIGLGTKNYLYEPAMSLTECEEAQKKGADIVDNIHKNGCNSIGFGEMGIGNTSSASLLMSAYTGIAITDCVGAGTGLLTEGIQSKTEILEKVLKKHKPSTPMEILASFGGFEIAMIVGAIVKAAQLKMTIVIDGFIVTAALLVVHALNSNILDYCIFAHTSGEQGHAKMLQFLNRKPILNLGLRLGEGTGAAIAFPIIKSAVGFLNDMASFENAQVSKLSRDKPTKH